MTLLRRFGRDESGATAVEYAMIAAGIGAVCAGTIYFLGSNKLLVLWQRIATVF